MAEEKKVDELLDELLEGLGRISNAFNEVRS